ncbi:MAG: rod shape-determining protein [Chloroflexi bacterium]|jgi:rod shape-determining protein MreB|uniref:Cell shape-determining protein MreB n=1 Tax=Candidatus Thermofonsia Clade 3 bacterium TaxID=2364212 RepID=A0A2M8QB60_9CHLR|nr:rod shape-determining protein [Candidatus Roseilinea sp. NK_OTU-006]PJF47000.1 MAG: rod shape-determining protein [Candidatus Thermofonsia Clade 3 bacterium]RMG63351.1 MAG: rod shape-determining protein [Chloroflexota bacterium]
MGILRAEIGIDLGTVNVLVYVRGKGIVIQEPSVVAILSREETVVEVGEEARQMYGRTPDEIEVARPLRDGVIADYQVTQRMLQHFVNKAKGFSLLPPRVVIGVPYGVTSVERRAVREAAIEAGAGEVYPIREPLAAAYGAGLPVDTATGNLVVDIGGGTAEAAVVSMNGIVVANSVRVGGLKLDAAIQNFIRRKYNLAIGEPTAEEIKINIGSALPLEEEMYMQVQGRDQVTGLPRTIEVSTNEIVEALQEPLAQISACVKSVLERTPPELASDIIDRGMALTGGTALLHKLDEYLTRETGVPAYVADAPIACVALGTGRALENIEVLKRTEFIG